MEIGSNGYAWFVRVEDDEEKQLADHALRVGEISLKRPKDITIHGRIRTLRTGAEREVDFTTKNISFISYEEEAEESQHNQVDFPYAYPPLESLWVIHGLWCIAQNRANPKG